MRVLITGNMGYVGPVLVRHLRQRFPQAELIGFDSGLFAHCLTTPDAVPEVLLDTQHFGDVRAFPAILLKGVDAVVHLSALSNDPMGKNFEAPTEAINYRASLKMAELARDAGVKHFVFASSCSVYGAASDGAKREGDNTDPLTAYARSKVGTEDGLRQFDAGDMTITCLRFATACGMSDRLRLDLVLNDFVACALTSGRITVLSDGSPWRPLIHVQDMARAIEWAATRKPEDGGQFLVVNAGSEQWNYQVRDLAQEVAAQLPGTQVSINTDAPPDRRSYRVDFSLFRELAPQHQPQVTLDEAISGLIEGLRRIGFNDPEFRSSPYIRLHTLSRHIDGGRLSSDIRWTRQ